MQLEGASHESRIDVGEKVRSLLMPYLGEYDYIRGEEQSNAFQ